MQWHYDKQCNDMKCNMFCHQGDKLLIALKNHSMQPENQKFVDKLYVNSIIK